MPKKEKLSWKYVFNSHLKSTSWWHIDKAMNYAESAGYEFFSWNGHIYTIINDGRTLTPERFCLETEVK